MQRCALLIGLLLCVASSPYGQGPEDSAITAIFKRADRSVDDVRIWRRVRAKNQLDLVIAVGTPKRWEFDTAIGSWVWWGVERRLGLFLQDRTKPGLIFSLTIAAGVEDCDARIVRATASDTVIACDGEKGEAHPNQKFVYDIGAKRLIRHLSYERFGNYRVIQSGIDSVMFAADNEKHDVTIDFSVNRVPAFRIVSEAARRPDRSQATNVTRGRPSTISPPFGPSNAFRLVQTADTDDCADPEVVVREDGVPDAREHRLPRVDPDCHRIGPWQIEGNILWFGTTFYAGEGGSGIGGFGFFDPIVRQFAIFSPPEVSKYSISAMNVQADAIWMAMESRGEYGRMGEGVVRYDRRTRAISRFDIGASIGKEFVAVGDWVLLTTDFGIVTIEGSNLKSFFVDQTTGGRLRLVEGIR